MTKYWTVQSKDVLSIVQRQGIYFPKFKYSPLLKKGPDIRIAYELILESFNNFNNTEYEGVLFSFLAYDAAVCISSIQTFEEFKERINKARFAVNSLWEYFISEEYVILELEMPDDFNPIFIDLNDFQAIMPPLFFIPPYTKPVIFDICRSITYNGNGGNPVMPSGLIQAHLPFIMMQDIKGVYPLFKLD